MSLNVNELTVGSYVCYCRANGYYTKVTEIRHCSDDAEDYYINGLRDSRDPINPNKEDVFSCEILHPLLLTDEILHKLGFEKQHNVGYISDDYGGNTIIYDDWEHKLKILMNYTVVFEKKYFDTIGLHTLQLALKSVEFKKDFVL